MKKLLALALLIVLCGCKCFVAGDFSKKRNHLHDMGNEKEYCAQNPDRCIKDVPW